jgi:hypothetical protein
MLNMVAFSDSVWSPSISVRSPCLLRSQCDGSRMEVSAWRLYPSAPTSKQPPS